LRLYFSRGEIMAVVDFEGFDMYNGTGNNTGLGSRHQITSGTGVALSMIAGRFGGQAFRVSNSQPATQRGGALRIFPAAATYSSFSHGFAFRQASFPSADTVAFQVVYRTTTTGHIGIMVTTLGAINVYRCSSLTAGTLIGSTPTDTISSSVWHYLEVEAVISDTVGEFRLYVDGVEKLNLSNVDTRNGASTTIDGVYVGNDVPSNATTKGTNDFDDMYFTDTATRIGERRIETLYPDSDVTQVWTRSAGAVNFELVDETLVDGDTTYVQGTTVGDRDTYGLNNLSSTPATVNGVKFNAFSVKTDAGARSIALQAISGATTSDGPDYSLPASYSKQERLLLTDPDTATAWTAAGVNALTGGPKVTI
jgi:hypothetical protein